MEKTLQKESLPKIPGNFQCLSLNINQSTTDMHSYTPVTPEELTLVQNSAWIYTKHRVIQKVYDLFGMLSEDFRAQLHTSSPALGELSAVSPKISRGEQYRQLPYVMLDFPRIFGKENTCAIRCFFWWGHYFSIHLHISGQYKTRYEQALLNGIPNNDGWYFGVNESPWEHHFEPDNYIPFHPAEAKICWGKRDFIKIGKKIPLSEWADAPVFYTRSFSLLRELLESSSGEDH